MTHTGQHSATQCPCRRTRIITTMVNAFAVIVWNVWQHVWPFESAFHIDRLSCDGIHGGWPLRGVGFLLRCAPTLYIIRHPGRGGSGIVLRYCEGSAFVDFGMPGEGDPPGRGVLPHCWTSARGISTECMAPAPAHRLNSSKWILTVIPSPAAFPAGHQHGGHHDFNQTAWRKPFLVIRCCRLLSPTHGQPVMQPKTIHKSDPAVPTEM